MKYSVPSDKYVQFQKQTQSHVLSGSADTLKVPMKLNLRKSNETGNLRALLISSGTT